MNRIAGEALTEIQIDLERAVDDRFSNDPLFQAELQAFGCSLKLASIDHSQGIMLLDSVDTNDIPTGVFFIKTVVPAAIGALSGAVAVWLQGHAGRKVRLKVGDIEVEARTIEEVEQLLQRAKLFKTVQAEATDEA